MHTALDSGEIVQRWRAQSTPIAPIPTGLRPRRPVRSGVRGVIFDVYGTLFVSAAGEIGHAGDDDERRFRAVLRQHGLAPLPDNPRSCVMVWRGRIQARHADLRGRGIAVPEVEIRDIWRETLAILRAEGCIPDVVPDPAGIERLALDYEAAVNPVWPMPAARRALAALQARGLLLGIISNAQFFTPCLFEALMDLSPEQLGFDPSLCVWSYRMGVAKPSKRLFESLLENAAAHGIDDPAQLLYVGNDMLNDVWAAGQAGLQTVLFAGDQRSLRLRDGDARCRNLQPDGVLTELAELPAWLATP